MKAFIAFTLIVAASALPRSVIRPVDNDSVSPGALRSFNPIPNAEVYPRVEEISDDNILELLLSRLAENDDSDDESDVKEKISLNDLLNLLEVIHNIHNNKGDNEEAVTPANEDQSDEHPGLVPDHENQNVVNNPPPQRDSDDENENDEDQQINNVEASDEQNDDSASDDSEKENQNENGDTEQPQESGSVDASNDVGDISIIDIINQNPAVEDNIAEIVPQNVQSVSGNQRFVNYMQRPLKLVPHYIPEGIALRVPNFAH